MNVDEATQAAKEYNENFVRQHFPLPSVTYSQRVAITLLAEVERLRAELAAAKAASELPVQVIDQVIITLANEVKRLQAEIKLQNKDWCEDDEAIKQQALRVLDAAKVEGDSVYVPRMGALAEMMADEIERLRIWNKRWRDVSARLRLTLAELITEELKQGKHYET